MFPLLHPPPSRLRLPCSRFHIGLSYLRVLKSSLTQKHWEVGQNSYSFPVFCTTTLPLSLGSEPTISFVFLLQMKHLKVRFFFSSKSLDKSKSRWALAFLTLSLHVRTEPLYFFQVIYSSSISCTFSFHIWAFSGPTCLSMQDSGCFYLISFSSG